MAIVRVSSQPMAAYLYLLHLDDSSLAWEFLRRNTDYRQCWKSCEISSSVRWCLQQSLCPELPAGIANPVWCADQDQSIRLQSDDEPLVSTQRFCLWDFPGQKCIEHDGCRLRVCAFTGLRTLRLSLPKALCHGEAYTYALRAGLSRSSRWGELLQQLVSLDRFNSPLSVTMPRPTRVALTQMRTLHALDAQAAGASHREIAEAIFGIDEVADRWHADSELRAQVRHLLKRGHAYVNGDYRKLLTSTN